MRFWKRSSAKEQPKRPDEHDPLQEFIDWLFRRFGEFAYHEIPFSSENEAVTFYNGLSFVSGCEEGETLGNPPDNAAMRLVRYPSSVSIVIGGHLTLEQNYEILYETQKLLKSGRTKLRDPQHHVAAKSQDHIAAKAFIAASQKLTAEHPEFFVKR
jgi:hypothetical protein